MKQRILIFIVSYHAEQFITQVLDRIPQEVWDNDKYEAEVLIIDDQSSDQTFERAYRYALDSEHRRIRVLYNPKNQGYGGNQKIGYYYAIENNFDAVVLLHGDGQYAPEYLPQMIQPLVDGEADAVFGSRMLRKQDALKGNMPLYKWVGNQVLTTMQNLVLGAHLSEFHTGYRAFSVRALASIPFKFNSNYFDFDTDIIIQLLDTGKRIKEVPIPTFYGEEISRVDGFRYGALILRTTLLSRLHKLSVFYHPKFNYNITNEYYEPKFNFYSSHVFALRHVQPGSTVLDLGCGPGFITRELAKRQVRPISIDRYINDMTRQNSYQAFESDVEQFDLEKIQEPLDTVLMLDIIEHLRSPEALLAKIRDVFSDDTPQVVITTANIAFLSIRIGLMLGQFNYGLRGILDFDHKRLFTFNTLQNLLTEQGFEVVEVKGIPAPFPLALGDSPLAHMLLRLNYLLICISKSLFSYQIAMVARPQPTLRQLLIDAEQASEAQMTMIDGHQ